MTRGVLILILVGAAVLVEAKIDVYDPEGASRIIEQSSLGSPCDPKNYADCPIDMMLMRFLIIALRRSGRLGMNLKPAALLFAYTRQKTKHEPIDPRYAFKLIFCDKQGAIYAARFSVYYKRRKNMASLDWPDRLVQLKPKDKEDFKLRRLVKNKKYKEARKEAYAQAEMFTS